MRALRAATRGWMLLGAVTPYIASLGLVAMLGGSAYAGAAAEERNLPMKFSWVACQPNCRGWVSAVGIVTAETPSDFDKFARGHQLKGETVVLDSSGGSVNDSIALGRRFRELAMLTTVGVSVLTHSAHGERASVSPEAYCESMCVFLLLSGKSTVLPRSSPSSCRACLRCTSGAPSASRVWRLVVRGRDPGIAGSSRSCIQPCSSHSWMALASLSTEVAHPRKVRIPTSLNNRVVALSGGPCSTSVSTLCRIGATMPADCHPVAAPTR